jgi:hypothetical protein
MAELGVPVSSVSYKPRDGCISILDADNKLTNEGDAVIGTIEEHVDGVVDAYNERARENVRSCFVTALRRIVLAPELSMIYTVNSHSEPPAIRLTVAHCS